MTHLTDIVSNTTVKIVQIHDKALAIKLMEIGLQIGDPIKVLRPAPLGCPIALEVNGFAFGLRCDEAKLIEVE